LEGHLVAKPLEKKLGFFGFGKYTQAPGNADVAFIKIKKMRNEPIEAALNSKEEDYDIGLDSNSSKLKRRRNDH
jgi:hypothetical protein